MSYTKTVVAVVAAAFALVVLVPAATAIKCYQCNSVKDPVCADVQGNLTASQEHLKECADNNLPAEAKPFCRKMIQTVLNNDQRRVIRKCGYMQSPKPCYTVDDDDHHEVVCHCFTDACNAALSTGPGATLAATAVSALIMVLAR